MTTHTPGPWTSKQGPGGSIGIVGSGKPRTVWVALVFPETPPILSRKPMDAGPSNSETELAANARLIAAAPALLEAAKIALDELRDPNRGPSGSAPVADQLRAAIAAAEGSR